MAWTVEGDERRREAERRREERATLWRYYPHESCEEWIGTPEGVTRSFSHFAGTPVWTCDACGHRSVYVECPCDLSHKCDPA